MSGERSRHLRTRRAWLASTALAVALIVAAPASAQGLLDTLSSGAGGENPVLFEADSVDFEQDTGVVIATGNVEISQGERVLFADRVTYDRNSGRVTASGNIRLLEPSGDVLFADAVELEDEFKEGVVRGLRITPEVERLLSEGWLYVAEPAQRVDSEQD